MGRGLSGQLLERGERGKWGDSALIIQGPEALLEIGLKE